MASLWTSECDDFLTSLKRDVLIRPVLPCLDQRRSFYAKPDWIKDGMGAVLLQVDDSEEACAVEAEKRAGGNASSIRQLGACASDLLPSSPAKKTGFDISSHSYMREASAIRWAVRKFCKYLYRTEFTVLKDCPSLKTFLKKPDHASHMVQRWKAELQQFHFVIEHCPARIMWE